MQAGIRIRFLPAVIAFLPMKTLVNAIANYLLTYRQEEDPLMLYHPGKHFRNLEK